MARVEMTPGWEDQLAADCHDLFLTQLGPEIAGAAKRYAPVKTGKLRDSIEYHLNGTELVVEAGAEYAAYLELGHRIAHGPQMSEVGPQVVRPYPFLRPALWTVRTL